MGAFEKDRDEAVPSSVRAAWDVVVEHWDDPKAHDVIFALTAEHQTYAWTAARYREARASRPAGATEPHLDRVRKAAEAALFVTATATRTKQRTPYASSILVLALVMFMILVGLMYAKFMKGRASQEAEPTTINSAGSPAAAPTQVR